jgi:hypothetical protein
VHDLYHDQLNTMNELLDIATLHTSGEEAVRVVFIQRDGITVPGSSWGHRPKPLTMALREVPKEAKGAKAAPPMTRERKAPMRSMLLSLSMISTVSIWSNYPGCSVITVLTGEWEAAIILP